MGLKIQREAKPLATSRPESLTLQSACHDYVRLVGGDRRPVLATQVANFTDQHDHLDRASVKRLFDQIWTNLESDGRSNVLLDLTAVRAVDPMFRTELTYLSGQLRQQRRFVRLSGVCLEGHWENWL